MHYLPGSEKLFVHSILCRGKIEFQKWNTVSKARQADSKVCTSHHYWKSNARLEARLNNVLIYVNKVFTFLFVIHLQKCLNTCFHFVIMGGCVCIDEENM